MQPVEKIHTAGLFHGLSRKLIEALRPLELVAIMA
jgi:hypothetical protein